MILSVGILLMFFCFPSVFLNSAPPPALDQVICHCQDHSSSLNATDPYSSLGASPWRTTCRCIYMNKLTGKPVEDDPCRAGFRWILMAILIEPAAVAIWLFAGVAPTQNCNSLNRKPQMKSNSVPPPLPPVARLSH